MNDIIEYIKQNYEPLSIIIYGSYADKSNNLNSDFDALVISKHSKEKHDISYVGNVQLDLFVYPKAYFDKEIDIEGFIQIFDGSIEMDTDNIGHKLKNQVLQYIENIPKKLMRSWCLKLNGAKKMLLRSERDDIEGYFRWHWVLVDSLEIFFNLNNRRYLGPKKSLSLMQKLYPKAFEAYSAAVTDFNKPSLRKWIEFLENMVESFRQFI